MKVIIVDEDGSIVVRTIEPSGLADLPGRYRVVRLGADGDAAEATPWMSGERAERRLHWEASILGLWVRDLRAFDPAGACVLVVECDKDSATPAWKSV